MNGSEELERLRGQVEQLQAQVEEQAARIAAMERYFTPRPAPAPAARPQRPSSFSLENFIGLRLIQFIGIIVLVIGLSIGVKYAIDRNLISELARILLAYAAGLLLFGLAMKLKKNFRLFSALLFSGGMASLYFTTYAANAYYGLFSFGLAFGLMAFFTVYTVYQALGYNRQEIALLGLVGAYGIPFLISKNSDRADLFFLYITLINSGVVFLCIRKLWARVGSAAQTLTWIIFVGWASTRMSSAAMGYTFMIVFHVLFLVMIVGPRLFRDAPPSPTDPLLLVFNNLALFFGAGMVYNYARQDVDYLVSPVALVMTLVAAAEALALNYKWKGSAEAQWMGSLAFGLFVLFIGLYWRGFDVTLLWLLTAVLVFAWGFIRHSGMARLMSIILIGLTLFKLVAFDSQKFNTVQKVIAYLTLGVLLLVASFFYQKFRKRIFES